MAEGGGTLLITGAGSGLGLETALYLAGRGYRVFGTHLTGPERETILHEALSRGVIVSPIAMDVTNRASIDAAVATIIAEAARIDGLIHFAGMGLRGFFEDLAIEEIRRVYEVNVFGIMQVTQSVLPHMRAQRRGRIIVTTSAGGRMGSMSISGYASSKFAAEGFAECLWQELQPFNIHVSLLEPGLVSTPHFTLNRNRGARALDPTGVY